VSASPAVGAMKGCLSRCRARRWMYKLAVGEGHSKVSRGLAKQRPSKLASGVKDSPVSCVCVRWVRVPRRFAS
jgi:hypothetical protein